MTITDRFGETYQVLTVLVHNAFQFRAVVGTEDDARIVDFHPSQIRINR